MDFNHVTVLKDEMIENLLIKKGGIYVDMTLGGGGHSAEVMKKGGFLIGIDQDENAIKAAGERLKQIGTNFKLVKSNFREIKSVLKELDIKSVDGIIMDLGVSSPQLDEADRGFSYMNDAPLDMRMDKSADFSAFDVVNTYSEDKLWEIIADYSEERWAKRIAQFIVNTRKENEIKTTGELVSIIKAAIPKGARIDGPHPAKRTFQAIRIEVNNELGILKDTIEDAVSVLNEKGRIGVITFHSLEDRIIKNTFTNLSHGCTCPKEFPVCMCGKKPTIKLVTRKPIVPDEKEVLENPRARSAKLRIAERI